MPRQDSAYGTVQHPCNIRRYTTRSSRENQGQIDDKSNLRSSLLALCRENVVTMNDYLCPTCGASWRCEHAPDAALGGVRYVPLDGPTARQLGVETALLVGEQIGARLLTGEEKIEPSVVERALLMQQLASSIASLSAHPATRTPSSTPQPTPRVV